MASESPNFALVGKAEKDHSLTAPSRSADGKALGDSLRTIQWDELDKKKYYFFGPTLFLGVRAIVYPSNLVKTILQVQHPGDVRYRGTFHAFREIIRREGFLALYKGFWANSLGIVSGNIYISSYEIIKHWLQRRGHDKATSNLVSGAFASMVSQTIVVPLDIVSQKLMVQKPQEQRMTGIQITRNILRTEGVRGLYRGYFVSIATYAPSSAIWWTTYELALPAVYRSTPIHDDTTREVVSQAFTGGISGVVAAASTNPFDVIRTRTQVEGTGTMETVRTLLRQEGLRGLYSGVSARMLSMGPSGVLVISTYELVKRLSRKAPSNVGT